MTLTLEQARDLKLQTDAIRIANIVASTDTDHRGELYRLVGLILAAKSQNHQASLFHTISKVG